MCEEIGINLSSNRSSTDREEMHQKWSELSTYNTSKTFLYYNIVHFYFFVVVGFKFKLSGINYEEAIVNDFHFSIIIILF